jgi:hypothetical protein
VVPTESPSTSLCAKLPLWLLWFVKMHIPAKKQNMDKITICGCINVLSCTLGRGGFSKCTFGQKEEILMKTQALFLSEFVLHV